MNVNVIRCLWMGCAVEFLRVHHLLVDFERNERGYGFKFVTLTIVKYWANFLLMADSGCTNTICAIRSLCWASHWMHEMLAFWHRWYKLRSDDFNGTMMTMVPDFWLRAGNWNNKLLPVSVPIMTKMRLLLLIMASSADFCNPRRQIAIAISRRYC
jgi:hypothetical protein